VKSCLHGETWDLGGGPKKRMAGHSHKAIFTTNSAGFAWILKGESKKKMEGRCTRGRGNLPYAKNPPLPVKEMVKKSRLGGQVESEEAKGARRPGPPHLEMEGGTTTPGKVKLTGQKK